MGIRRGRDAKRSARLVVLGDLVLDVVAHGDGPVAQASDVSGTVRFRPGGSAANTSRAFARLGGRATFIGAVGRDEWARRLTLAVRAEGVTAHTVPVALPTARLVALVRPDGERSFVVERGAADALQASDVDDSWFRSCEAFHLPGYSLFTNPWRVPRRGVPPSLTNVVR